MSKCSKRLVLWLFLAGISIAGGIVADFFLRTEPFPLFVRLLGLAGMVLTHFPLKRTGKLLKLLGQTNLDKSEGWGCTNRLITSDLYQCVRHPHHLGIGIFMTCLGLLIGHPWSFLIITFIQWSWILGFLFLVEEPELVEKFGAEYKAYCQQVPMLIPKSLCALRVLTKPMDVIKDESGTLK
jgi:protein-S-isoprenylcysteine O-methyltransferase Ste14